MPVRNPYAIDYKKGTKRVGECSVGNVIGAFVMTTEEANEVLKKRQNGKR